MVINFLGDSITQGAGADCVENTYVSLVGTMLGCEAKNYGVGGTRIAKQKTPSSEPIYDQDFLMRSEEMGDADFVFVFGGTNDYGHGDAEMGALDSEDVYTFCGGVNTLFKKLIARYGKEKLCIILPLHRYDEENLYGDGSKTKPCGSLQDYVNNLKTLANQYGLEMMSFDAEFPIPTTCAGDDLTVDGLHPNNKGHKLIAEKICEYVRKKINI